MDEETVRPYRRVKQRHLLPSNGLFTEAVAQLNLM